MHSKFILLVLLLISFAHGQQYFQRHEPTMLTFDKDGIRFEYEKTISVNTARRLHDHFLHTYGTGSVPSFYTFPSSDLLVASAYGREDSLDNGFRLFFFRMSKDSVQEIWSSSGAGAAWFLRPVFFVGRQRVLVLAEHGWEHTDGFLAVEYSANTFRELGSSPISTEDSTGDYGSPTENVLVRYEANTYFLEFTANVIMNPTATDEVIKLPKAGRLVFHYDGKKFIGRK